MAERIDLIPLSTIKKIQIYINTKKLSLANIIKETGADYAITGNFYTSNWKATCQLKADGVIQSKDQYNYYPGFAWDSPSDFRACLVPTSATNYKNYYSCCSLIDNGIPNSVLYYNRDVGGVRGRTGIGLTKDNQIILYASTDGSSQAKTPEKLRDYIYSKYPNIKAFVMNDGGGKVNYAWPNGKYQGISKSQNLILIYLNKGNNATIAPNPPRVDTGNKIIQTPISSNPCFTKQIKCNKTKFMLHSTGTPGATANDIRNNMNSSSANTSVEFVIDDTGIYQLLPLGIKSWHCGSSANNTHVACEICEPIQTRLLEVNWKPLSRNGKYNTKWAVTQLQKELMAWGYNPNGLDGSFGPGCEAAIKAFQKDNGLGVDGSCGPATKKKLASRKGSYLAYNPNDTDVKAYFDNVYAKAVWLCAFVLKQVGGKASQVVCHKEGYNQGIASNHADVLHWFPEHSKTMNDFRTDVERAMNMNGSTEVKPNPVPPVTNDGVDSWAAEAWDKACDMGLFDGTRPKDYMTRQEMAVVLDRLNLLG